VRDALDAAQKLGEKIEIVHASSEVNAATGISLALRPTHWQLHVETLPKA